MSGKSFKVRAELKKEIWSENIDYLIYIIDSSNQNLLEKRNMTCILVTTSYANEFIYITSKGLESLCEQTQSSRVLLIRPSQFNHDSPQKMKDFVGPYCARLFSFENIESNKIKFISLSDAPNSIELFSDDKIVIRDVKDITAKKNLFRQVIFKDSPNEIETEMKLYNVPEQDSKSSTYKPVKTSKQYRNQKLKTCVDVNMVISHFIRVAISAAHFLDCNDWANNPLETLILGGTFGILPYFTKRVFREFMKVTSVEENEKFKELGVEYFGFDSVDINWIHQNSLKFLQSKIDQLKNFDDSKKKKKTINKYDLIIINESNFKLGEKISPNPNYFKMLEGIKVNLYFSLY